MGEKRHDQFKEAGRNYQESAEEFAKSGKVSEKAEEARKARQGDEQGELSEAEDRGERAAAEKDPNVRRDYSDKGSVPTD